MRELGENPISVSGSRRRPSDEKKVRCHAAIEQARTEAAEQGGVEFEAVFDELLGNSD